VTDVFVLELFDWSIGNHGTVWGQVLWLLTKIVT